MTTNHNVKVATYPDAVRNNAGQTRIVEGAPVEYVCYGKPCHIEFQKYTKDYSRVSARPYRVFATQQSYASLKSAVRALFKAGFLPL